MDKSFILKRVQDEWMKIGIEFNKRLDSELPFFYSSTVHDRFYEGERPHFNSNLQRNHSNREFLNVRHNMLIQW